MRYHTLNKRVHTEFDESVKIEILFRGKSP